MRNALQGIDPDGGSRAATLIRAALADGRAVVVTGFGIDGRERAAFMADAAKITAETVNLMVTAGRGVITCALDQQTGERLGLSLLPRSGTSRRPLFMRSVEAAHGVTTGISAADRALTLRTLGAASTRPDSLVSPGHVMPSLAPLGCGPADCLPDALLAIARQYAPMQALAWCDMLDDSGDLASHAHAAREALVCGSPLLGCERLDRDQQFVRVLR